MCHPRKECEQTSSSEPGSIRSSFKGIEQLLLHNHIISCCSFSETPAPHLANWPQSFMPSTANISLFHSYLALPLPTVVYHFNDKGAYVHSCYLQTHKSSNTHYELFSLHSESKCPISTPPNPPKKYCFTSFKWKLGRDGRFCRHLRNIKREKLIKLVPSGTSSSLYYHWRFSLKGSVLSRCTRWRKGNNIT